jgi:hypothetical protein
MLSDDSHSKDSGKIVRVLTLNQISVDTAKLTLRSPGAVPAGATLPSNHSITRIATKAYDHVEM